MLGRAIYSHGEDAIAGNRQELAVNSSGATACTSARAEGERDLGEEHSMQRCRGEQEDKCKATTAAGIPGRRARRRGKRRGGGVQRVHADAGEWWRRRGHGAMVGARRLGGGRGPQSSRARVRHARPRGHRVHRHTRCTLANQTMSSVLSLLSGSYLR